MKHYVYFVKHNDIVIYIGKGTGIRHTHAISGNSHNKLLNELYFKHTLLNHPIPTTHIITHNTQENVDTLESSLINILRPKCNVDGLRKNTLYENLPIDGRLEIPSYILESFIIHNNLITLQNDINYHLTIQYY